MFNVIVLATTNQHKVRELKSLLQTSDIEFKCLSDFGTLPPAIEDGLTFDENAYKKALHYAKVLGVPCLADDSGLCVKHLQNRPGVYSARYAGEHASDDENCTKLLNEMSGIDDRSAFFVCVLSIAVPSGPALTFEAVCDGIILDERRGNNGFGYDPLFFYEPLHKTFAELSLEEKNLVSHRGKVLQELKQEFPKVLQWIDQRMKELLPEHEDHHQFLDNDWSR